MLNGYDPLRPNEQVSIFLFRSLMFWFPLSTPQADHIHSLPALQMLQQDFLPVGKTHCVAMGEGFQTLLDKNHFFGATDAQALPQMLWDVAQQQSCPRRHTYGRKVGGAWNFLQTGH